MADDVRLTHPTLMVLRAIIANPTQGISGAEISRATKLMSGTLYPILGRLEEAGWLESEWENVDPREVGRPRRRLYMITRAGRSRALAAFADLGIRKGDLAWIS